MFDKFFHSKPAPKTAPAAPAAAAAPSPTGDTATVRRIVAKLEAMPPEQARLIASAAYTLARAANADLDISDDETAAIEHELQVDEALDEATAVLVTEMAKLQAKTVGGTEDYVVTREFKALADESQRLVIMRACFAVVAANGTISAEETARPQRDRRGARHRRCGPQQDPGRLPRAVLIGAAGPAAGRERLTRRTADLS